eukprot:1153792-Pelagomonas_calceolata.AAC.6
MFHGCMPTPQCPSSHVHLSNRDGEHVKGVQPQRSSNSHNPAGVYAAPAPCCTAAAARTAVGSHAFAHFKGMHSAWSSHSLNPAGAGAAPAPGCTAAAARTAVGSHAFAHFKGTHSAWSSNSHVPVGVGAAPAPGCTAAAAHTAVGSHTSGRPDDSAGWPPWAQPRLCAACPWGCRSAGRKPRVCSGGSCGHRGGRSLQGSVGEASPLCLGSLKLLLHKYLGQPLVFAVPEITLAQLQGRPFALAFLLCAHIPAL